MRKLWTVYVVAVFCLLVVTAQAIYPLNTMSVTIARNGQKFGHDMKSLFKLRADYVNINHGSYGSTPLEVLEAERQWQDTVETHPDRWFRTNLYKETARVREEVAEYIHAKPGNVVLIENASGGVNAVLRSLKFEKGDYVLYMNIAYPMVTNTLKYLVQDGRFDQSLIQVNVTFPIEGDESFLEPVRKALDTHGSAIKLCVFDHISSAPTVILPIHKLGAMCSAVGAKVLIDGAHVVGQIPLHMDYSGTPDPIWPESTQALSEHIHFYVTNGHKWLFSPKGSAIMWVREDCQSLIAPTVISSTGKMDYLGAFEYTGTRDYTPFITLGEAIKFRHSLGDREITEYNHALALQAGKILADTFGTELLFGEQYIGSMPNILLPHIHDQKSSQDLVDWLFETYDVFLPVFTVKYHGQDTWWCRVSAQIFMEESDYQWLADVIMGYLNTHKPQPEALLAN